MNAPAADLHKSLGDRAAVFSRDLLYRYRLIRLVGISPRIACFVMLNPSTADHVQDDATIRRCVGFARRWECGELMVANLYAFRATQPTDLFVAADPIGKGNVDYVISAACRAHESGGLVVAAWGAHATLQGRQTKHVDYVVSLLTQTLGIPLQCLGKTAEGFPRHPLRLSNDTALEPYQGAPLNGG